MSTRIKDAHIAIRYSRKYSSILQGVEMGRRAWTSKPHTEDPRKSKNSKWESPNCVEFGLETILNSTDFGVCTF